MKFVPTLSAGHSCNLVIAATAVSFYRANCNLNVGTRPSGELAGIER
jgi:hypothetical protein